MKSILNAFFNAEKEEKISDKALFSRIVVSVVLIVICLIAMSISAYAYFAYNVSSQNNVIKSASYDLAVTPSDSVETSENKTYVLGNDTEDKEQEHIFSISTEGTNTTASVGYCKMLIWTSPDDLNEKGELDTEKARVFYTKPIWLEEDMANDKPDTRTLKISVPAGKIVYVSFVAEWGSCSKEPIIYEEVNGIKINIS